ncbi:hypothetical protein [Neisseria montereyensis]|uniref:Uncharacterized protein n=1 Tax=Neisseria montereyensis TaxID=2973938 RepID=A0ABT2FC40_9NEIS|nr:hypothetical protein [Neisseria montereyensis]MCS4533650.1 hypothetical protein [Neisseria montereyensis]
MTLAANRLKMRSHFGICLFLAVFTVYVHADGQGRQNNEPMDNAASQVNNQFEKKSDDPNRLVQPSKQPASVNKISRYDKNASIQVKAKPAAPNPAVAKDKAKASERAFRNKVQENPPFKDLDKLSADEREKVLKKSLPMIGQYGNIDSTGLGSYPRLEGEVYRSDKPIIYYIEQ